MRFQKNYSLKNDNTFRVDVKAKYFCEVNSEKELLEVLSDKTFKDEKKLVLGSGANILFTKDFDGLVIKMRIKGIKIADESDDLIIFDVGAGENWHNFVMYSVEHNCGGVENMVYIPGTVGAAAVQNIAAYGQNFSEVFVSLTAVETETGKQVTFDKDECEFEYRDSRFKTREAGKYAVTSVRLRLNKNPQINSSYFETGKSFARNISLAAELQNIDNPNVKDVAEAVMRIRKNKLPEIAKIGTAGSFFKNPLVSQEKYQVLKKDDPDLQCYPKDALQYIKVNGLVSESEVKIPAARLLDSLGWKGKRIGNVGTFATQALAVVNYGATPKEILDFTKQMQNVVYIKYNIKLEPEVQIL